MNKERKNCAKLKFSSGDQRHDYVPMLERLLRGRVPAKGEHQGEGDRLPDERVRQGDQRLA